jgi:hypothetical protein
VPFETFVNSSALCSSWVVFPEPSSPDFSLALVPRNHLSWSLVNGCTLETGQRPGEVTCFDKSASSHVQQDYFLNLNHKINSLWAVLGWGSLWYLTLSGLPRASDATLLVSWVLTLWLCLLWMSHLLPCVWQAFLSPAVRQVTQYMYDRSKLEPELCIEFHSTVAFSWLLATFSSVLSPAAVLIC